MTYAAYYNVNGLWIIVMLHFQGIVTRRKCVSAQHRCSHCRLNYITHTGNGRWTEIKTPVVERDRSGRAAEALAKWAYTSACSRGFRFCFAELSWILFQIFLTHSWLNAENSPPQMKRPAAFHGPLSLLCDKHSSNCFPFQWPCHKLQILWLLLPHLKGFVDWILSLSPKFLCWNPALNMVVFGTGAFGR